MKENFAATKVEKKLSIPKQAIAKANRKHGKKGQKFPIKNGNKRIRKKSTTRL
jgi:hypothetical protein